MAAPVTLERTVAPPAGPVKRVAEAVLALFVLPAVLACRAALALMPARRDTTFQGWSQCMSLWPGTFGNLIRRAFYRGTLRHCSRTCSIGFGTLFATNEVEIGENVYIGPRCMIGHAIIEDDVLIGSNVDILSGASQHHFDRLDVPVRLQGGSYRRIRIGRDAWLGNGSTIMNDVGEQAIVAAGAVVVKPVDARVIVGGNPARELQRRGERTESEAM